MNKDALLATAIGFTVGLLVTSIVIFGPNIAKNFKGFSFPSFSFPEWRKSETPTPTKEPEQQNKEHEITIESPLIEGIENNEETLVSGMTTPGATVIISSQTEDTIVSAGDDGKYAGKVSLSEGKNTVSVLSMFKEKQAEMHITVFYTPEDF